jgi:hypothetical protein
MRPTLNAREPLRHFLRQRLGENQVDRLKKMYRGGQRTWLRAAHPGNLRRIGETFAAGKYDWYYGAYERHFGGLRRRPLTILEIGIGGYETPSAGGGSLRMWECYFPRSRVYGVDIYDKSPHDAGRVRTFRGSQTDEAFLASVLAEIGRPDIIIDDGSHLNDHVLKTFKLLFPKLAPTGIYVIEDVHSSYWESFGGSSSDLKRDDTTLGMVKNLIDGLNFRELRSSPRAPGPFDDFIVEIHCYHNIVFLQKGANTTTCGPGIA